MLNKKTTGSYYTPKKIADFLVDYLSIKMKDKSNVSVLEPSVGDGVFINAIYNHTFLSKISKITAIEQNIDELNKIPVIKSIFKGINADFLEYQKEDKNNYDLVIGNPPYIKKGLLERNQVETCKEIHSFAKLSDTQPKNIWTAFLVRSIKYLNENGILAFILPSELLQVKFATELRELILKEFERVEIFTFNELLFKDCKGQDTLILIGEKKAKRKGVYYCNIDNLIKLEQRNFQLEQNISIRETKWTHHHLTAEESELLVKLKEKIKIINHYCDSKAGIVTAANDYFIVNKNIVEKYALTNFVKPIIQKGLFVNGSVVLSVDKFQSIIDNLKPAYLLSLNNILNIEKNKQILEYLKIGEIKEIHKRYKATIRNKWYEVPNIGTPPEAFFFKRCHDYPKFIKNEAKVLSTDSAYIVNMKENFTVESLIYSFYNSLTLSFSELHGRYYGGGVLELTPNEFKNLPIPYIQIKEKDFNSFEKDFKNKISINNICLNNDLRIIKSIDNAIDIQTIEKIHSIKNKLYNKRIRI